jgi:hypothetical protein
MKGVQIVIRVENDLATQLDEHARQLNRRVPEVKVTRSAAARDLLRRALRLAGDKEAA